ncbi:MAG: hypothetical protein F6K04_20250 [Leptolyngbya sp. SIO4C5]|nr:hypothetical protein [Leptolyngbya sp. SIO4C5]
MTTRWLRLRSASGQMRSASGGTEYLHFDGFYERTMKNVLSVFIFRILQYFSSA